MYIFVHEVFKDLSNAIADSLYDALKRQTEDTVIDKVPQAEHIVFNVS